MASNKNPPSTGPKIIKSIEDPTPPPKDYYAKYKTTTRAYKHQESLTKERITTFFNLSNHVPTLTAMLGRSPMLDGPAISEHAKFCTESWWMIKVERAFEDWLGLLKCDVCGMGVEEIYKGLARENTFGGVISDEVVAKESDITREDPFVDTVQTGDDVATQMDIDPPIQQHPTPPLIPSRAPSTQTSTSPELSLPTTPSQRLSQENPVEVEHQKYFNEDPWELLVGSKNVLMDSKPWELTQEFLDEIRRRWNQGSALFLFEEGVHLRPYEDCDGFADEVWVWI